MSISRKNWSALSSVEQMQLDFVEMLRVRDEKRRMRHVETLRRQKEEEEVDEGEAGRGGSGRVEILGDLDEEQGNNTFKTQPPSKSSVSISLDKSPSVSGSTSPMSPRSPNFEPTAKPAFVRQSSRTVSFRMMRKKEEETSPLQRASVRMASKKFECNTDQDEDEDKASSFQRSRQRISSRSIQEKMERLAQAAQQKSEATRSPDMTQRSLFLLDEVSRKRGLFEKEQPAQSLTSPGVSRQEFRSFTSGMSDRINRWMNKANQPGSSHGPSDLRHVDINSKRSLFENRGE
uniref:Ladinin n=1 Tax=Amphiprion percula TaxID=161767 RepID=A0A3P8S212_AMPPE